jgi:hypothetical protein
VDRESAQAVVYTTCSMPATHAACHTTPQITSTTATDACVVPPALLTHRLAHGGHHGAVRLTPNFTRLEHHLRSCQRTLAASRCNARVCLVLHGVAPSFRA